MIEHMRNTRIRPLIICFSRNQPWDYSNTRADVEERQPLQPQQILIYYRTNAKLGPLLEERLPLNTYILESI